MKVTFIAHAGISVQEENQELLIDPWFNDSTREKPLLESLWGGHKTIDFQIPPTKEKIASHEPRAVLVSHFHTHHAPHDDVLTLVSQSPEVLFGYPDVGEGNKQIQELFGLWPHATAQPWGDQMKKEIGPFSVRGITHTVPQHIAWYVQTKTGSLLHIADPKVNRDNSQRDLDEAWKAFEGLEPDMLFINAGGNSYRTKVDGKPVILESIAVSPVEAARITSLIKPKSVSLIGCYNHSVARNRTEYIAPYHQVEDEFHWAVSWLLPETKVVFLKPGHVFGVGDDTLATQVDTYLGRSHT